MIPGDFDFSSEIHDCGVCCPKLNYFTFNQNHMTTQSKTRFADALALSKTLTMDNEKLCSMIDLVIPVDDRKALWKNVEQENGVIKATVTSLNVMILGHCQISFHTEPERDAAYLLCITQNMEFDHEDLQLLFQWYTSIPTDIFIITG